MFEFIGRFHPLLVHLPIGFLLIAVVFIWVKESGRAVKISIGLGALAAIFSVITGLLLADSEGYSSEVNIHKWSGIVLSIVSVGMYFFPEQHLKLGSIVMTVLIFVTGHFGGTLTHGSLIAEPEAESLDLSKIDLNNAAFYNDAVNPILQARCVSCHGDEKQKGGLRLDNQELILKGGKNGSIITSGNPEESELIKRIDLPIDDEDHMPPKEKKQLTDQEKKLISLWVSSGADFNKKISESLNEKQVTELFSNESSALTLPDVDVPAPNEELISKLIEANVAITPVAKGSHFLQVNLISVPNEAQKLLEELRPIAKNVVVLKLNSTKVDDNLFLGFDNLVSLSLADTKITDATMDQIVKIKSLTTLNISGTGITSIEKLKELKNLKYLNIYKTSVKKTELPGVKIETGDYDVPTLETDTTVVKSSN